MDFFHHGLDLVVGSGPGAEELDRGELASKELASWTSTSTPCATAAA
jgi:hypothetical protein